jgi:hypothetical protein
MLERAIIPAANIQGDQKLIPMVNRTVLSPQFNGDGDEIRAGFHSIESSPPTSGKIAMLARWEHKGMVPSHELLTVMQAYNTTPEHVKVQCGKYIRVGKNGPVIPIDSYGQTNAPESADQNDIKTSLDADTIITQKKSTAPLPFIATIHAEGERTSTTNALSTERLETLFAMIHAYPVPIDGSTHKRLPLWAELIILLDTTFVVYWLSSTSRFYQHLGAALSAALIFPLLYALMDITQHWMVVSAPLATLLTGWLAFSYKRPITSEIPQHDSI